MKSPNNRAAEASLARSDLRTLDFLRATERPLGAYTIVADISASGKRLHGGTVYRTLARLLDEGLIIRTFNGGGYVAVPDGPKPRAWAVLCCDMCREVRLSPADDIANRIEKVAASHSFKVERQYIECDGLCGNCVAAQTAEAHPDKQRVGEAHE